MMMPSLPLSLASLVAASSQDVSRDAHHVPLGAVRGLLTPRPHRRMVAVLQNLAQARLSAARPTSAPSQVGEPGPATGRGLLPAACPGAAPSQVRALPTLKNKRTFVRITQVPFQQLEGGLKADDHDRSAARRAPNRPARYAVWRSPANRA
jgi:hypothetical protein